MEKQELTNMTKYKQLAPLTHRLSEPKVGNLHIMKGRIH